MRKAATILTVALVFGQAKMEATLYTASMVLGPITTRAICWGIAFVSTVACYYATETIWRRIETGRWREGEDRYL